MTQEDPDVAAVNFNTAQAVLDDGRVLDGLDFYDEDGEACAPREAVIAVCPLDDKWLRIDLTKFERASTH